MALKKSGRIDGQFIAHTREMRESLAWAALPWNARRVLDRLELEHLQHGGQENGRLICTYDQLAAAGIRRQSVAKAIRQAVALGFVVVVQEGYRSPMGAHAPSRYGLTYLSGPRGGFEKTDAWRRLDTQEKVDAALEAAEVIQSVGQNKSGRGRSRGKRRNPQ